MGVCLPNFRTVSFFVWPGDVTHILKYTHTHTHTYTSELNNILGGCSPHVDFENKEDSGCNINTNTHIRTLTQLTV